jgi:hypothetical protein
VKAGYLLDEERKHQKNPLGHSVRVLLRKLAGHIIRGSMAINASEIVVKKEEDKPGALNQNYLSRFLG